MNAGRISFFLLSGLFLSGMACRMDEPSPAPYRTVSADPFRDTELAKRENQAGLAHLAGGELDSAVQAFERALTADNGFGPAHNNLGKAYFLKGDLYKAAWEFEYARKLLPRSPQPCNNLGIVFEQNREWDKAVEHYRQAVALDPENLEFQGNLTRALVLRGDRTDEVRTRLKKIIAQDKRNDWIIWANKQLEGW
jgi:Flp pilus assembly protein TadD